MTEKENSWGQSNQCCSFQCWKSSRVNNSDCAGAKPTNHSEAPRTSTC